MGAGRIGCTRVVMDPAEDAVKRLSFPGCGTKDVGLPVPGVPTENLNVDLIGSSCTEEDKCYNCTRYIRGSNSNRNLTVPVKRQTREVINMLETNYF
jgi:hypothetical protein